MKLTDLALVFGATVRLSRFVTTDSLGDWYIVQPAKLWAEVHETSHRQAWSKTISSFSGADTDRKTTAFLDHKVAQLGDEDEPMSWQAKLVEGLECPACVGFWIGAGVVGSYLVAQRDPRLLRAWRVGAGIFGLNYAVFHVSSRID